MAIAAKICELLDERDQNGRKVLTQQFLGTAIGVSQEAVRRARNPDGVTPAIVDGINEKYGQAAPTSPGAPSPAPTPTRTIELDTHRDRLWIRSALEAAGFPRGVASDVALTVQFQGAESPEEALARAKELAEIVVADPKGKLITSPQPPHPKKPPKAGR